MSYLAPRPEQSDEQWQRLLREKLGGDREAVQQVEALIRDLRAAQLAQAWQPAPPDNCDSGPVPHC